MSEENPRRAIFSRGRVHVGPSGLRGIPAPTKGGPPGQGGGAGGGKGQGAGGGRGTGQGHGLGLTELIQLQALITLGLSGAPSSRGVVSGDDVAAIQRIGTATADGTGTALSFTSIPAGFSALVAVYNARSTFNSGGAVVALRVNGDSGANYDYAYVRGNNNAASATNANATTEILNTQIPALTAPAGQATSLVCFFPFYANTTFFKSCEVETGFLTAQAALNTSVVRSWGTWRNTAAITSLSLTEISGGNIVSGSQGVLYALS